jgi:hypothetical protein
MCQSSINILQKEYEIEEVEHEIDTNLELELETPSLPIANNHIQPISDIEFFNFMDMLVLRAS